MGFYQSISEHYQQIFPLNRMQVSFVMDGLSQPEGISLLDVGCGTGELAYALSNQIGEVIGIDLDEEMLRMARERSQDKENLQFLHMNMLALGAHFDGQAFNMVNCFGNTLVHLKGPGEIAQFLSGAEKVLKPGGKLLLQIINYDRILDNDIKSLPPIETPDILFVRNYTYNRLDHLIEFETNLTIKSGTKVVKNMIHLYPLRREELASFLLEAGFSSVEFFGNYKREALKSDSIPLVIEAGR